jgi:hypothetical protein
MFTHDCVAKHNSNTIFMFADDTTVVILITDNDETAYREEVKDLAVWCQENNLSLNLSKSKELIVDYRKKRAEHAPIHIDGAVVGWAGQVRGPNTKTVMKTARQHICPLRRKKYIWHGSPGPQSSTAAPSRASDRLHHLVWQLLGI